MRVEWGITTLSMVDQRKENDLGGMWENWDVQVISFAEGGISDEWSPLSLDTTWQYHPDSLHEKIRFLNGMYYSLQDGRMISFGGGGYGSFDWMDITWISDTVSIVATSCTGHCGDQPVRYSKNVFDPAGKLVQVISYPLPTQEFEAEESENILPVDYEAFLVSGTSTELITDTIRYQYNGDGLLTDDGSHIPVADLSYPVELFTYGQYETDREFHQYYVGDIEMEKFFRTKLGYTPQLVLIEIYRHGVFSFVFNPSDNRYYRSKDLVLEQ